MNTTKIDWIVWRRRASEGLVRFLRVVWVIAVWLMVTLRKTLHMLIMWPSFRLPAESRKPYLIGLAWSAVLTSAIWLLPLLYFGTTLWPEQNDEEDIAEELASTEEAVATSTACGPSCVAEIRAARKGIAPIEANEARYVLDRYNNEYVNSASWRKRTEGCLSHWDAFQKAERLTLYPAELLAGKAFVEALGCQFIGATNGDGGIGPMQITHVSPKHLKDAATALGISVRELRYKENSPTGYLHNVVLGAYVFGDYEVLMKSRGVGMLAYNAGPGHPTTGRMGARGFMRRASLGLPYTGRQLSDFRGVIPDSLNRGARPKVYVDRVLAGAVMVDRAHRGLPLVQLDTLNLKDIPGHDPRRDGERFVAKD